MSFVRADLKKAYSGKRVLVTGHTGFKGAWLSFWLHELGAKVYGYSLEEPGAPAAYTALGIGELLSGEKIGDLGNFEEFRAFYEKANPQAVFHLAAQSLVRLSYREPLSTLRTNFMGTAHVLEMLRIAARPTAAVIVTSDKCYHNQEWVHGYRETDRMGGRDIYSMSKGACELLTDSFRNSFFPVERLSEHRIAVATARAGNVIGGGDYAEDRIIPDCVRAVSKGKPVILRNPKSTRPWQHVLEPLSGYLTLGAKLLSEEPESYCEGWNFGPAADLVLTVREVVEEFLRAWGSGGWEQAKLGPGEKPPHEASLLRLSIDKAISGLHWFPKWDAVTTLGETARWYKKFESSDKKMGSMRDLTREQIQKYWMANE